MATEEFIPDYEEDVNAHLDSVDPAEKFRGSYSSIHSSGFRDFLLKPELLRAIKDRGYEHPSQGKTPSGTEWDYMVVQFYGC